MVSKEDGGVIRLIIPEIGEEEIQAVTSVLHSGYLVQGSQVREFERLVAHYLDVKYAIAVSSGTAALHIALLTSGIRPGDEVIIPDFTFPATANVVELIGAKPVFVDIDLTTFNIAVNQIRPAITKRTKAIMPVHLFGQSADMQPLLKTAVEHDLLIVEDAACALGAEYHGRKCGTMGHVGCFSFHPRKVITTGEGGMIVTNDESMAERLRRWRNHGITTTNGHCQFEQPGFNYRMTDMQGALGVAQMTRLETIIARRIELAGVYDQALAHIPFIKRPIIAEGNRHIWQSYVILLHENIPRDDMLRDLKAQGVEASIGTYAVSAQPYYTSSAGGPPNSYRAYQHSVCLPLHLQMRSIDVKKVVNRLENALWRTTKTVKYEQKQESWKR
jgi:perosamine synthetase